MTLQEAVTRCMERPEMRLVLPGRHIIEVSLAGKLMELSLAKGTYARFSAQDLLAITWQVFTEEQIAAVAEEQARAQAEAAGRSDG